MIHIWLIRYSDGFNPRSHEGNDDAWFLGVSDIDRVSIHVPTRGTTKWAETVQEIALVSIHVPTRGTTEMIEKSEKKLQVSIHVPTRGTTAIIYKFPLYFLLLSMQLYQYNPGNASPADHTHLTLSQYYGANLPDTLCPLLFRTNPVLYCCFI